MHTSLLKFLTRAGVKKKFNSVRAHVSKLTQPQRALSFIWAPQMTSLEVLL